MIAPRQEHQLIIKELPVYERVECNRYISPSQLSGALLRTFRLRVLFEPGGTLPVDFGGGILSSDTDQCRIGLPPECSKEPTL